MLLKKLNITTIDGVREAIGNIKKQGEGANDSPEDNMDDLAHFYRFGEIRHRRKLKKDAAGNWHYDGDVLERPDVHPMAKVPEGGHRREDVSPEVWALLETFDRNYSLMLNQLQAAWQGGSLTPAVTTMRTLLESSAVALMQIEIASGKGNYGHCFRLV